MSSIILDRAKCVGCGRCLIGCSARLFVFDELGNPPCLADNAEQRCIECGHCVCLCPVKAISVESISVGKMSAETVIPLQANEVSTFDTFLALTRQRRSIRHYRQEPIKQADWDRLFELAQWAPTAKNLNQLKWIVVNNPTTVRELAKIAIEGIRGDENLAAMVAAWDNGYDWILRGAPAVLIAYTDNASPWTLCDSTIAAETMDLGATALGMGACWAGLLMNFLGKNQKLRERLGLKEGDLTGAALMLGYPDEEQYDFAPLRPACDIRYVE